MPEEAERSSPQEGRKSNRMRKPTSKQKEANEQAEGNKRPKVSFQTASRTTSPVSATAGETAANLQVDVELPYDFDPGHVECPAHLNFDDNTQVYEKAAQQAEEELPTTQGKSPDVDPKAANAFVQAESDTMEESEDSSDEEKEEGTAINIIKLVEMWPKLGQINGVTNGPLEVLEQVYVTPVTRNMLPVSDRESGQPAKSVMGCVSLPTNKEGDTSTLRFLLKHLMLARMTTHSAQEAQKETSRWLQQFPTIKFIMNALFTDREASQCLSGDGMGVLVRMDINNNGMIKKMGVFVENQDHQLVTVNLSSDILSMIDHSEVLVLSTTDNRPIELDREDILQLAAEQKKAAAGGSAGFDNLYNPVFNARAKKMSDQELCKLSPEDMVKLSGEMQAKVIAMKKAAEEEMEDEYTDQEEAFLKLGAEQIMALPPDKVSDNVSQDVKDILTDKVKAYWDENTKEKTFRQMEWIFRNMQKIAESPFCDEEDVNTARDYQKRFRDIQTANALELRRLEAKQEAYKQGKPVESGSARERKQFVPFGFGQQVSPQKNAKSGSRSIRDRSKDQTPSGYEPYKRRYGCSTCGRLLVDALNNAASASKAANAARKAGNNEEADTLERKATDFEAEAETLRQGKQSHKMKGPKCPRYGDRSVLPTRARLPNPAAAQRAANKLLKQAKVVMSGSACNGAAAPAAAAASAAASSSSELELMKQVNAANKIALQAKTEQIEAQQKMLDFFMALQKRPEQEHMRSSSPAAPPSGQPGAGGHY